MKRMSRLASLVWAIFAAGAGALAAQEDEDKWDVEAVHGPVDTLRFETDEGTWISLDVSPDGQWIAFDLLGDIYRMPITGGRAVRLSGGFSWEHQPRYSPDGSTIAFTSDRGGADNIWLMNADGSNRRALTELEETLPTNPVWHPGGEYLIAKRHVTNTRSLGGGEIWMFHVDGGNGIQVVEKASFTSEMNEPYPSPDGEWVYYSVAGPFDYNRDPHAGIFQLRRVNTVTGRTESVTGEAGGAVRPVVSPDGSQLAFVRRIGLNSVLMIRDLATGAERVLFDGLEKDQQETWVVHGAYPGYQWTPDGGAIVISFGGRIWSIDTGSGEATNIPFTVEVEQPVTQAVRSDHEVGDEVRARVIRWASLSPDGSRLLFQALGHVYTMTYPNGRPTRLTDLDQLEFAPSYSPDGAHVVFTTWSSDERGAVWVVSSSGGTPTRLTDVPDQYTSPSVSPDGSRVAFIQGSGVVNRAGGLSGETFLNLKYVPIDGGDVVHVTETPNRGANTRMPRITWSADGQRLMYEESESGSSYLASVRLDGSDKRRHMVNERASEIVPSPDGRWVAFKELHQVYVAPLPVVGNEPVTIERNTTTVPVKKLTNFGGDWIQWRPDSQALTWSLGPAFYTQTLSAAGLGLLADDATDAADEEEEGTDTEDAPWPTANIARGAEVMEIALSVPRARPSGTVMLRNARVITMRGDTVLERGDITVTNDRIVRVARHDPSARVPAGARVVDLDGATVMPGIVDVHAHMGYIALDINPDRPWQYYANLAYGVTTTHDPSASTQFVFSQAELVEAGLVTGPRVYSTGFILYGAENNERADIKSLEDAEAHLTRLHSLGAFSVKSYNQLRRDSRQWVIAAARERDMLVVPEGGSMYQQNMTQIIDGHTGIEHAIPIAPLYRDAITLLASSNTGYTPTLVVGYGGVWGENYWYQESDVFRNQRLLQFVPRSVLDSRARRRMLVPEDEFYHIELARTARDVVEAGGSVQLGAHGQLQGLGAHWELWMFAQGGMTPLQAIRAATLAGARYLGLDGDIGSIEEGKLADLVILGSNPLENIRNTEDISMVMKNGVLFDSDMNQLWPVEVPVPSFRELQQ